MWGREEEEGEKSGGILHCKGLIENFGQTMLKHIGYSNLSHIKTVYKMNDFVLLNCLSIL